MKRILLVIIVLLSVSAKAQDKTLTFPEDYFGVYKGDLEITNTKGKQNIGRNFISLLQTLQEFITIKLFIFLMVNATIEIIP